MEPGNGELAENGVNELAFWMVDSSASAEGALKCIPGVPCGPEKQPRNRSKPDPSIDGKSPSMS